LGVCLLDLKDPAKVKAMSERAILIPEEQYELVGQTPSVVFTCGAVVEDSGEVKLYYGGADTVQCVATTSVERLTMHVPGRDITATLRFQPKAEDPPPEICKKRRNKYRS
jgi:predicted GH43/DUF377 family glycosyl hydrolase